MWKPDSMPDILEAGSNELELVEFWIYDERCGEVERSVFGVNVAKVREVIWLPEVIKIPNLPEAIEGVINLRGEVIPVIDLAKWMRVKEPEWIKRRSVIITEFYKVVIGFIVHEAKRIRRVSWVDIKPAPEVLAARFGTKITGVVEIEGGEFLLVLDLENVLAELGLISLPEEIEVEDREEVRKPILLVDDSSVARKVLKEIYERGGFKELYIAKDGKEAWELLLRLKEEAAKEGKDIREKVSLVVTDLEMPRMDGYSLVKRMKGDVVLKEIPVIINTSLSEESNIERARKVEADAFFVKFEPEELIKVSKKLVKEKVYQRKEAGVSNMPEKQEKIKEVASSKEHESVNAQDEIEKLIQEFKAKNEDKHQEVKENIEEVEDQQKTQLKKTEESVEEEKIKEDEADSEDKEDIVDKILSELEEGLMGKKGETDLGSYTVPTAEDLKKREDLENIIEKLEKRLEEIPVSDEAYRLELMALIESLKSEIDKRKEREEGRVIEKLYKVTKETEEETVKLMERIEAAMDIVNECIEITNTMEKDEKVVELADKLNILSDMLFEAINQLQFQDITRQKIERVIVALKKLNDYLNEWFGTDFIGD